MVSVSSSPPHSLNGVGCAQLVQNGGVSVSIGKISKTTNNILYGPPSGGAAAATGAAAQSWSDG